ncbi:MAG TPA: nitrite reductase [Thermoanaerobaculia bacterium]|nr:nitrite reductase [Thermoanaerobaculia bacterium]
MTATVETKAQKVERLKREKNPWEALDELRAFAPLGFENIPADWLGTYLRWWGVYTQGDGAGVLGGAKGEGRAAPFFMARIRLTNGLVDSHQLRTIARVAEKYARGTADITVRQNIQLHWIRIENLPDVLDELWSAGLTTMGSCGDDTRNITGCPLAGIDADELLDASPLALEVTRQLVGNAEFYNLPRKFKVAITGCRSWCSYPEINDVALTAIEQRGEVGFSLRVAGGLSSEPHLAVRVPVFVRQGEAIAVVRAIAEIFREAEELREHRDKARLKYLFLRHGWTAERMRAAIEQRLGYALETLERDTPPPGVYRDHVGVHPQQQEGLSYVGINVLRGRVTPLQLVTAADLAERYGTGQLRTTNMQNLLIPNVRHEDVRAVVTGLESARLPVAASPFARGAVACTGMEFCKLAITETKSFTRWLVHELEERLPGFAEELRLNVTGCPNSCGQHWIADIGIEGKKVRDGGRMVDAYYFCVGGAVGAHPAIARPVGYRCAATDVPDAIERLLRSYLALREEGESLREFFARHSTDALRSYLAGMPAEAVERDRPAAAPPHGLEV